MIGELPVLSHFFTDRGRPATSYRSFKHCSDVYKQYFFTFLSSINIHSFIHSFIVHEDDRYAICPLIHGL